MDESLKNSRKTIKDNIIKQIDKNIAETTKLNNSIRNGTWKPTDNVSIVTSKK